MVSRPDTKKARLNAIRESAARSAVQLQCPRLCVFRSTSNIYAQIIDDVAGVTLAQASSLDKEITGNGGNKEAAKAVGKLVAERAKEKNIVDVVFDRGGIYITAVFRNWPKAPVRAASISKEGGITLAKTVEVTGYGIKRKSSYYQPCFQNS
jgi:large subunit ribosomal protein L18